VATFSNLKCDFISACFQAFILVKEVIRIATAASVSEHLAFPGFRIVKKSWYACPAVSANRRKFAKDIRFAPFIN
jgi:hypothetical protein